MSVACQSSFTAASLSLIFIAASTSARALAALAFCARAENGKDASVSIRTATRVSGFSAVRSRMASGWAQDSASKWWHERRALQRYHVSAMDGCFEMKKEIGGG